MAYDSTRYADLIAKDGQRLITLTKGFVALIDEADWELVSQYRWHAHKARSNTYARSRGEDGRPLYLHRLIVDAPEGKVVDHQNHCSLDCRRSNLVVKGVSANAQNAVYSVRDLYRGVSRQRDKYRARIMIDGVTLNLGLYPTPEEAAAAYDREALMKFGPLAWTNAKAREREDRASALEATAVQEFADIPF